MDVLDRDETAGAGGGGGTAPASRRLVLRLDITEPELVEALAAHAEGPARDRFALTALRIGVLALRQAEGRIDAEVVRTEGQRVLADLAHKLDEHRERITGQMAERLREYFDPQGGRFSERIERLIRKDGELEQLLQRQIGDDDSRLARTLASHVGATSPLMQVLSPDDSGRLLAALRQNLEDALREQREGILREFSRDNPDGALGRLVQDLTARNDKLTTDLRGSLQEVVGEFSLDREDSALSRLVRRVEEAQRQIRSEFSLDAEQSALSRVRRELLDVLEAQRKTTSDFQADIRGALESMKARREEALRSTRHGGEFEDAVAAFVLERARAAGDLAEPVGNTTGTIPHCKVGDVLLRLGADSASPGASIVVEAKQAGGYTLAKALSESETARKNRGAQVGLFVFSVRSAPEGLTALARHGDDLVVVWDAEDPASDVYLDAALSVARALCTRAAGRAAGQAADIAAIERSVRAIEKQAEGLDEITRSGETIRGAAHKILERARIVREALEREVGRLDGALQDLRAMLGGGAGGA